MVLGNNGLIAKAKDAKNKTEQDQINTETGMNNLADEIDAILGTGGNGGSGTGDTLPSTEGTTPYLPSSDFSKVAGTDLDTGLVIQDNLGNQYVWIEVPNDGTGPDYTGAGVSKKETYTDTDYTNIENALKTYTNYYRNGTSYTDTWYSSAQHGFASADDYNALKNAMLKSVYENGGFYIGKYEAGIEAYRTSADDSIADDLKPLSKANQYPLNYVTCSQAQMLAERVAPSGYNSSLMFGVQWDLVLKYIEEKAVANGTAQTTIQSELRSDSTSWGNYNNANFDVTNSSASYSSDYGASYTQVGETTYPKPASSVLLTTGANETRNSKMNICDLAGNVWEWTLEYTSFSNYPCAYRGGYYNNYGSSAPASGRDHSSTTCSLGNLGFRVALY